MKRYIVAYAQKQDDKIEYTAYKWEKYKENSWQYEKT